MVWVSFQYPEGYLEAVAAKEKEKEKENKQEEELTETPTKGKRKRKSQSSGELTALSPPLSRSNPSASTYA